MDTTDKVSVIVPSYNRSKLLPRALQSIMGQTYPNLEVVVVDDGSAEDVKGVVDGINDGRIMYLRHDANRGVSAARNTGIAAASGRYIGFLDSDDEWLPRKVEKQLASISKEHGPSVCYCFTEAYSDDQQRLIAVNRFSREGDILHYALIGNGLEKGWTGLCVLVVELLMPREVLLKAGQFDERYRSHEDWELLIRLAADNRFVCVPEVLVRGHKHGMGHIVNRPDDVVRTRRLIFEAHRAQYYADRPAASAFFSALAYYQGLSGRRGEAMLSLARAAAFRPLSKEPYAKAALLSMGRLKAPEW